MNVLSRIARWWYRIGRDEELREAREAKMAAGNMGTEVAHALSEASLAMIVYKIENGYVARINSNPAVLGPPHVGFYYCKDHKDLADYIVSEATREKLGLHGGIGLTGPASTNVSASQYAAKRSNPYKMP